MSKVRNYIEPEIIDGWPNQRGLDLVLSYHDMTKDRFLEKVLSKKQPLKILDIGCGQGVFVKELKEFLVSKGITAFISGVTTAKILDDNEEYFDELSYAYFPNESIIKDNNHSFDFVFDTFASVTYYSNPLHALLGISKLLNSSGEAFIMTSGVPESKIYTCIGDINTTVPRIASKFKTNGTELVLKGKTIQSLVKLGNTSDDFSIHLQNNNHTSKDYNKLVNEFDYEIGVPVAKTPSDFLKLPTYQIKVYDYSRVKPMVDCCLIL